MPLSAPVIPGQDMPGEVARVRMNFTTPAIDQFGAKL